MNGPRARFLARLESELALSEQTGPAFLFGVPAPQVLHGLAASAAELILHCSQGRMREIRKVLRNQFAVAVQGCPVDGEGLPVWDQPCASCVIADLPLRGAEDACERALSMVADGGTVWLLLERRSAGNEQRLRRMLEAACGGALETVAGVPEDLFVLRGRRSCAVLNEIAEEQPQALPVSVVVVTRGQESGLEDTLVDLLLRQHLPPRELFVLDLGGSLPLAEDLFGLAQRTEVPVAVFSKHGATETEALVDALGGVQSPFVHWCAAGARLAPHGLTLLGMALEREEAVGFAVARSAPRAEHGAWSAALEVASTTAMLTGNERFSPEAVLWRTQAIRAAHGLDPNFGDCSARELAWRLQLDSGSVLLAIVVAGHPPSTHPAKSDDWRHFLRAALGDSKALSRLDRALVHLRARKPQWVLDNLNADSLAEVLLRAQALQQLGRTGEAVAQLQPWMDHPAAAALLLSLGGTQLGAWRALVLGLQGAGIDDSAWLLGASEPPLH